MYEKRTHQISQHLYEKNETPEVMYWGHKKSVVSPDGVLKLPDELKLSEEITLCAVELDGGIEFFDAKYLDEKSKENPDQPGNLAAYWNELLSSDNPERAQMATLSDDGEKINIPPEILEQVGIPPGEIIISGILNRIRVETPEKFEENSKKPINLDHLKELGI